MRVETFEGVTLYCGDAREALAELEGAADLLCTDPPYLVTPTSRTHYEKPGMIRGGWMGESYPVGHGKLFEVPPFESWLGLALAACKADADAYVMTNDKHLGAMQTAAEAAGWRLHNVLVWRKPTGIPNRWYFKDAEFTLYLWKGKAKTIRRPSSCQVFEADYPRPRSHNSEKPVPLMAHYISNSTDPGALVLDPFMGSGATAIAALELGRRFVGVELDEADFDAVCRRVEAWLKVPRLALVEANAPPLPLTFGERLVDRAIARECDPEKHLSHLSEPDRARVRATRGK